MSQDESLGQHADEMFADLEKEEAIGKHIDAIIESLAVIGVMPGNETHVEGLNKAIDFISFYAIKSGIETDLTKEIEALRQTGD